MDVMAGCFSFLVTVVLMFALRPVAVAIGLVAVQGPRGGQDAAVPVIGGVAMSIGLAVGTGLSDHYPLFWTPILIGIYLLVVVGTIDDRFDLPLNVRLVAQCCSALLMVFAAGIRVTDLGALGGERLSLGFLDVAFTMLFVVALVNAFNIVDGLDGLAGGLAFLSLAVMSVISASTPLFALVVVATSVVGAFLLFNLPLGINRPVRSFMGDAGSTSLGLIIATVGIYLTQGSAAVISPVVGLWFVAIPVFDLFAAIVRRLVSNRSPFERDHGHLHHVLVDGGLSQLATLVFMLGLALALAAVGLLGHAMAIADGVLLVLWLVAGIGYYQILRFPRIVVVSLQWLRQPLAVEVDDDKLSAP